MFSLRSSTFFIVLNLNFLPIHLHATKRRNRERRFDFGTRGRLGFFVHYYQHIPIQDVTPNVVAIAVSTVIRIWRTLLQIVFFIGFLN